VSDAASRRDLVSVVIPTHARCQILQRTLRSVLEQEDVDLEVVVVDDGSADGTPDMLAALTDPRVRALRHETPKGVGAARNAGIGVARGRWLAFLDDDDLWAPRKLVEQLRAVEQDGEARWSAVGTVTVDGQLRPLVRQPGLSVRDVRRLLLSDNQVPGGGSGVLAERALVVEVGMFDELLVQSTDWDLWIRLALASPVAFVPELHLAYVQHGANVSRFTGGMRADFDRIRDKYADERSQLGVRWPDDYWERYIAETEMRSGRRREALASHRAVFRAHRHWSWLPLAAAGGIAPRTTIRAIDRWHRLRMGRPSEDEVAWLRPYWADEERR
jgi:glycosyltransferase involved in cell wall biosynthesis